MIPDVTPNGVFYLPPTGWLTSFYNLPYYQTSKEPNIWEKTEVMEPVVDGQQSLFSEQEMDQLQDPDISVTEVTEKKIKQVVRHRKAKQSGQQTNFLDGLPQVEEVIPLKDTNCPHCH